LESRETDRDDGMAHVQRGQTEDYRFRDERPNFGLQIWQESKPHQRGTVRSLKAEIGGGGGSVSVFGKKSCKIDAKRQKKENKQGESTLTEKNQGDKDRGREVRRKKIHPSFPRRIAGLIRWWKAFSREKEIFNEV
jgi:hypothetical protein